MAKKKHPRPTDLVTIFSEIEDFRVDRTKQHNLCDILVIAACSMITTEASFTEMEEFGISRRKWLEQFLELPNGIPSHDTFRRVFTILDPDVFLEAFALWTRSVWKSLGKKDREVIAIDGKALRGAVDSGDSPQVIVGAWAAEAQVSLGLVKVADKSNEIKALSPLLEMLALKGAIVTIDAMGCQREVAAKVRERGGDYVLALKGNQSNLHLQVKYWFEQALAGENRDDLECFEESCRGRGRQETRRCWVTDDLDQWLEGRELWEGLRSVALVECERIEKGNKTVERRLFITSLAPDPETIARAVRSHWGIENSLHWVLDVVFGEDKSRARQGYAAQNLSALRRWSHSLIKSHDPNSKLSVKRRRLRAALDPSYLENLLGVVLDA